MKDGRHQRAHVEMTENVFATRERLRWLETVSSTFQDLEFDGPL